MRIKPHLSQFQSKKSRLAHDSSLVRRYKYGSASKIFLIFFCVFKDLFYLKMFAFLLRTFCKSVISKIRLLSVKKIQLPVDFGRSAGYFFITIFSVKFLRSLLNFREILLQISLLKRKKPFCVGEKFFKFFFS